jgi:small-conductance mechanosensitive channel
MRVLRETADALPGRLVEHEPVVLLTGFGDSSLDFEVSAWTADPWLSRRALSQLNEAIWWALKQNGVTIPFPQRDVHLIPVS